MTASQPSPSQPVGDEGRTVAAHDIYTHGEDGRVCVVLEDGWFVPLDAGGEGYDCERHHGPTFAEQTAPEQSAVRLALQVARVRALVDEWTTATCQTDGAPCSWHRVAAECAAELQTALEDQ